MRAFIFVLVTVLASVAGAHPLPHSVDTQESGLPLSGGPLTGPLLLPDGTAAAPGWGWAADADGSGTGMYKGTPPNTIYVSIDGTLYTRWLSNGTLQFVNGSNIDFVNGGYIYSSSQALALGTACAAAGSTGDVCTGGNLQVDGNLTVGGNLFGQSIFTSTNVTKGYIIGNSSIGDWGGIKPNFADDGMALMIGAASGKGNHSLVITGSGNSNKDHGHNTLLTNPTVFIHSGADVDTDDTQRLSLAHDQTNAVIAAGKGSLDLSGADSIMPPVLTAAVPAEPHTCDASHAGAFVYVDDTNDTAYARYCACANLDGTGYDWRDMGDMVGTACPFF